MSTHEFAIPVHDLDAAGKAFSLRIRPAWLRGALEGTDIRPADDEGEIDVRLSKSGRDVVVRGRVNVRLFVPCARCLEPACIPISEELTALAVPGEPTTPRAGQGDQGDEEEELSGDEADTIPYDGETVVLDNLVRDVVLLGVPMIPLCSEACPGISQQPMGNAPETAARADVDPRLKPLLTMKKTRE